MSRRPAHDEGRTSAGRPEDAAAVERELERIVAEAEVKLAEVRRELAERRMHEAQHAEIDRLEEHLANATVRWSEVRAFFDEVLDQLRHGTTGPGDDVVHGPSDLR
ncbi:hypothetical protein ACNHYB_06980 [Isoptericola jiangsuensis]|uniref:hypothetical protein n=1 Tax=Isoptericola jiangsuensis TaxID=548579 RepID=UPI003AAE5485